MKFFKYAVLPAVATLALTACNDDDVLGNPQMDVKTEMTDAHFGDSLKFVINASDAEVPLSTIHAELWYGDEKVEETVIRTKESGKDYEGKIYIPYFANVPDGRATLKLWLQNIEFTKTEQVRELSITHADYPYLTLVTSMPEVVDGVETTVTKEFRMERNAINEYSVTQKFPQKVKAFIRTPKVGENGNELTFGWANNEVAIGADAGIPFSYSKAGKYTISFNTYSFAASPFVTLKINGVELTATDDTHSQIDMNLSKGQNITLEGFPNINDWWIDPDFFSRNEDGSLTFLPIGGNYRIIADQNLQYFRVYALNGSDPATLADDGSGALWVIGTNIGKPSVSGNEVGWTTENALCMAQVEPKVYEITVVGGKQVSNDATNFKFFGQMGWGVELKGSANFVEVNGGIVGVGDGTGGHDDGNLYLLDGVTLKDNEIYKFRVDLTGGITAARLTVTDEGEQPFEEKPISLNGSKMSTTDNAVYNVSINMNPGDVLNFNGIGSLEEYYLDPDYFTYDADNDVITFAPVAGAYKITLNNMKKYLSAVRLNSDGKDATFDGDGKGIWLMGWGVGSPSLDGQFGWTPGAAYCMAEVAAGVYRFTGVAGPEKGSDIGMRFRTDYLSFKFFGQNGWGYEFAGDNALTLTAAAALYLKDAGNFELADGVTLEEGATYVITLDVNARTLDMIKK